jgi:hypothetical protein
MAKRRKLPPRDGKENITFPLPVIELTRLPPQYL